jgi:hypothetical protein
MALGCVFPVGEAAVRRSENSVLMPNAASMRLVRRYLKPGHVAEIRERTVVQIRAFEFFVFVNGNLIESQLFHGRPARLICRRTAGRATRSFVTAGGWRIQPPLPDHTDKTCKVDRRNCRSRNECCLEQYRKATPATNAFKKQPVSCNNASNKLQQI